MSPEILVPRQDPDAPGLPLAAARRAAEVENALTGQEAVATTLCAAVRAMEAIVCCAIWGSRCRKRQQADFWPVAVRETLHYVTIEISTKSLLQRVHPSPLRSHHPHPLNHIAMVKSSASSSKPAFKPYDRPAAYQLKDKRAKVKPSEHVQAEAGKVQSSVSGKSKGKGPDVGTAALPGSIKAQSGAEEGVSSGGVNIGAPSQAGQSSRKGKKAWRKNVDIAEIEQGMEDAREEERVTG
jgi:hypothetical protein